MVDKVGDVIQFSIELIRVCDDKNVCDKINICDFVQCFVCL